MECNTCIHKLVCKYAGGPFSACNAYIENNNIISNSFYPGDEIYVKESDEIKPSQIVLMRINQEGEITYEDSENRIFSESDYLIKFALDKDEFKDAEDS